MAAQGSSRYFRRLQRWMRIGSAAARPHASMPALPTGQKAAIRHERNIITPLPNVPLPGRQDASQRRVHRLIRSHEEIIHPLTAAGLFERLTKCGQLALIRAANDPRIGLHLREIFEAFELNWVAKRKVQLSRIEHLE